VVQPKVLLDSLLRIQNLRTEETLHVRYCSVVVSSPNVVWKILATGKAFSTDAARLVFDLLMYLSNVSEKGTELGEAGVTGAADVTFLVARCKTVRHWTVSGVQGALLRSFVRVVRRGGWAAHGREFQISMRSSNIVQVELNPVGWQQNTRHLLIDSLTER